MACPNDLNRPVGRPRGSHLCTPHRVDLVEQLLRTGIHRETAFQALGISARTGYSWIEKGRAAQRQIEDGSELDPAELDFLHFFQAVERGTIMSEIEAVAILKRHTQTNWRAAAWFLSRRYPDRWGSGNKRRPNQNSDAQVKIAAVLDSIVSRLEALHLPESVD